MSADQERIAEIAVIARNRRNRKGKTLPLMNADNADQKEIAGIAVIRNTLCLLRTFCAAPPGLGSFSCFTHPSRLAFRVG